MDIVLVGRVVKLHKPNPTSVDVFDIERDDWTLGRAIAITTSRLIVVNIADLVPVAVS